MDPVLDYLQCSSISDLLTNDQRWAEYEKIIHAKARWLQRIRDASRRDNLAPWMVAEFAIQEGLPAELLDHFWP